MTDYCTLVISAPRTLDLSQTIQNLERAAEAAGCSFVRIAPDTYHIRPIVQPKRRTWAFLSLWSPR